MRQCLTLPAAILALCIVVPLFSIGPYRPAEPLPPDIVDMHCHIAGIGAALSEAEGKEVVRGCSRLWVSKWI